MLQPLQFCTALQCWSFGSSCAAVPSLFCNQGLQCWTLADLQVATLPGDVCSPAKSVLHQGSRCWTLPGGSLAWAMKGRVDWTNLQELFASCVRELWQTGWCSNRLSGLGIRGSGFGARGACQEAKLMRFFEQRNKSPLGFRVIGFQGTLAPRLVCLKLTQDSR